MQINNLVNIVNTIVGLQNKSDSSLYMDAGILIKERINYKIVESSHKHHIVDISGKKYWTKKKLLGKPGKTYTTKYNAARVFKVLYDKIENERLFRHVSGALRDLQLVSSELSKLILKHKSNAYSKLALVYDNLGIHPVTDNEKRLKNLIIRTIKLNWKEVYTSVMGDKLELIKKDEANFFM